ncbi:MAG: sugar ABC transporter substrate-binding protein [Roseitalea sp.]|jgi:multiple sugar transport system substrate-binding protein|nr:sugar ABC transporter substrate-binding protein [Roseitalea sp.]MBO6720469.1 sugar ABC transporter substrate-binding protein [Roseitalea sp.]MBO6743616.1 sugar ABC transporter substrate-binding protein [Roseitalea sp.]
MFYKEMDRRRLLLSMGAAAMTGGLLSSTRMTWAQQGNSDPVKLLLGSHMEYLQKLAPDYAAAHGPTPEIELVTTPDLPVKLNSTLIARRSPGDAVFVTAAIVAGLAEKGWLTDMTDLIEETLLPNGLIGNSLTAVNYQGRYYGVPVTIGAPIMHWNKDLFAAAGLDTEAPNNWHASPGSWDTVIEYAQEITDPDNNIYGITDNWGGVGAMFTFGSLMQGNGGRFLDDDLQPIMNSEAGVEALSRMVDLLHVHEVIDPAVVTYTWVFDASPAYLAGQRGIFFTWPFIAGIANGSEDSAIQGRSGYAPNPALETSASIDGSEFLSIPVFANNPDGGRQFIELATSLDNQIVQGSTSPWAPSVDAALRSPEVIGNLPFAEVIRQSYQYPVDGGYSADRERWQEILTGQLSRAFAQEASPKEALDEAVKLINASRT